MRFLAITLAIISCGTALASDFNLATDFVGAVPQAGNWRYGYRASYDAPFIEFTQFTTEPFFAYTTSTAQNLWKNTTGTSQYGVLPGHVSLHPGSGQQPTVARFVCPENGYKVISGSFGAGDNGSTRRKAILINGETVFSVQNDQTAPFSMSFNLHIGDVVDFQVDNVYAFGNTQVDASISDLKLSEVEFSSYRATGGEWVNGIVSLNGPAPAGGVKVRLDSNNSAGTLLENSVTIPAGGMAMNFEVATNPVSVNTPVTINAHWNGQLVKGKLVVIPARLASLDIEKTFIKGGQSTTGSVTLANPAGPAGAYVTLTSGDPSLVSVPGTVFILPGQVSATFTVNTSAVAVKTKVDIVASEGPRTKTVTMNLKP